MLTDGHGRQRGEQEVVEHQVHLVDHHSSGKAAVNLIPETDEHESLGKNEKIIHVFLTTATILNIISCTNTRKRRTQRPGKKNHSCFWFFNYCNNAEYHFMYK